MIGIPLPHGNRHHTRHLLNQKFLQALLLDFEAHGREAIEECRKQSALGYVKFLGHLVPREMKVEHSQSLKSMSDEELEAAIAAVREMLAVSLATKSKSSRALRNLSHYRRLILCQTAGLGDPTSSWLRPTRQSAHESASRGSVRCHRPRARDLVDVTRDSRCYPGFPIVSPSK
jgi:hypothetical protein